MLLEATLELVVLLRLLLEDKKKEEDENKLRLNSRLRANVDNSKVIQDTLTDRTIC